MFKIREDLLGKKILLGETNFNTQNYKKGDVFTVVNFVEGEEKEKYIGVVIDNGSIIFASEIEKVWEEQ